jgi:hypothetical protein
MKLLAYKGWQNCYQIESGECRMIATADIGPRIVHLSRGKGDNLLKLFEEQIGKTGGNEWRLYGGHRVWYAPEDPVMSYIPDNDAVEVEILSDDEICLKVRLTPEVEKSITMRVATNGLAFELVNRIQNLSDQTFRTASWGITTFAPGGVGYLPISKGSSPSQALCSNCQINLWDYTNLSDSAFVYRSEWIECHQKRATSKQKIGTYAQNPWLAYRLGDSLVVKTIDFGKQEVAACEFPDQGSNVELYFDAYMLELEGLSHWSDLKPGESVSHTEKLQVMEIEPDWSHEEVIELVKNSITSG